VAASRSAPRAHTGTSLGEAGCVGSLPAVMLAIMNALEPLGVRELDMPATSERVWQAIQRAGTQVLAAPRPEVQL
jgi:carbon-monoxide dehydrogenase large subunit